MAGNEWINGYLEAILDTGASAIEEQKPAAANLDRGHFNPTKYFVEEVVSGVDESDLHRTWLKVVATRNTRERSSRLENMCWRIWHLTRKKKQVLLLLLLSCALFFVMNRTAMIFVTNFSVLCFLFGFLSRDWVSF